MPFLLAIFAFLFIVVAIRNTQSTVFDALSQDVPAYGKLLLALVAIGLIGYLPRMEGVSRGLMALFVLGIFLTQYQGIISNYQGLFQSSSVQPVQPAAAKPLGPLPVSVNVGLGSGGNQGGGNPLSIGTSALKIVGGLL